MVLKHIILLSLIHLFFTGCSSVGDNPLKVMSFNIRYDNPNDGINAWDNRKSQLTKFILEHEPAIIGMQEVLKHQLDYIDEELSMYNWVGVGREDGKVQGEFAPILYNSGQFQLIKSSTFWLSEQPDRVSKGWDAALERICTYAVLRNKQSKDTLVVVNTHFDHQGSQARLMSAKLILQKIEMFSQTNLPVILMGDLNSLPESDAIQAILSGFQDGKVISESGFEGPEGTFNNFNPELPLDKRIDYIFVKTLRVLDYQHLDTYLTGDSFISDHIAVFIEIMP